ncbi:hypothetical protein [Kaistia sp. UC242_56]|uniref:hypothetical protein n=1 Tax=Kaistia sp. UC242_56 TaxID=3374625 RepID=UPI003792745A
MAIYLSVGRRSCRIRTREGRRGRRARPCAGAAHHRKDLIPASGAGPAWPRYALQAGQELDGDVRRVTYMSISGADLAAAIDQLAKADLKKADPFRPCLNFLIGHFTFTLAILAATLASLPKKGEELAPGLAAALGGVLAWMALSALVASIVTLLVQVLKARYIRQNLAGAPKEPWTNLALILCALPLLPGAVAVAFCLQVGVALLPKASLLPPLGEALRRLLF